MSAHAAAGEMEKGLALRCHELKELASRVRRHLIADLKSIEKEPSVYRFCERLKEPQHILNKVVRARGQAASAAAGTQREPFQPDNVTDAWGCRFVTLIPSETIKVMASVFRQIETWARNERQDCKVSIEAVNIYTNRPGNDPLAMHRCAKQLAKNHAALPFLGAGAEASILPHVDSRDTGYSSVHFVLRARLPGREGGDAVRFEIQIRDIFEEAWGQLSHALSYGEKDRPDQAGAQDGGIVEVLARPHLNALKAIIDGCGQMADQIGQTYGDLRGRLGIVDLRHTYRSITPLQTIYDSIVSSIGPERVELIEAVTTAYDLVRAARDAADRHFDNRVARSSYRDAADKFEEAIRVAGNALDIVLRDGKKIGWYLKIEQANALIFSLPTRLKDAGESEERNYRRACSLYAELEEQRSNDPVMLLRSAQAQRKDIRSRNHATAVITRLEDCLRLLQEGAEKREAEAALTGQLARIELGLARLDYSSQVAESDPAEAEAALRQAIRDVQSILPGKVPPDADRELLRVYHRAISNVLWFYHRLRTIENVRLSKEDEAVIAGNIGALRGNVFWPTVRFYAETIENLMYGYEMIGKVEPASEMADLIVTLLREMANDKRRPGDRRDTTEFLNAEETEIYAHALEFQQKKLGPAGGRRR